MDLPRVAPPPIGGRGTPPPRGLEGGPPGGAVETGIAGGGSVGAGLGLLESSQQPAASSQTI